MQARGENSAPNPDRVRLGRISGVQGLKGWLKVFSDTQPREKIFEYPHWLLIWGAETERVVPAAWKPSGKTLIVSLEGVETREQAELLVGAWIELPAEEMPALESGEFYWYQLEGLIAWVRADDGSEQVIGRVDHLLETGANDVLVVKPTDSSIDDRERLIPWSLEKTVSKVDLESGRIELDWNPEY
jgi:16S rRNA processing protein RimM